MKKNSQPPDENPEWTKADFARARPASKAVGKRAATALIHKGGRPAKAPEERKQQVTMRFAPDLLAEMRASGAGWQTRAEAILAREFLPMKSPGVKGPMTSVRDMMSRKLVTKAPAVVIGRVAGSGRAAGRGKARSEGGKKRA